MSDANIFKLPTTFKHNHHDHDCSCVKCYVDKITITPKVEFVWLIEYFFVLLIDDYHNNQFLRDNYYKPSNPRSPPVN
jgi:hypothetical protein